MKIKGISVLDRENDRLITVTASLAPNEELNADDVASLESLLDEADAMLGSPSEEQEEAEAEEAEEEAEPEKPKRRRRTKKDDEEEEAEEEEEKPKRRRRTKKDDEEEEAEEEEEKPKRRRRSSKKDDDGPSAEDVAKAASMATEELGTKYIKKVILEYSDDGTMGGIPADKRQDFIDEINADLEEEEE